MDVIVRNKKTGEEKTVPIKVYEALKHIYMKVGDAEVQEEPTTKKNEGLKSPADLAVTPFEPAVIVENGKETPIQVSTSQGIAPLVTEYETLTGKKPDGRWSEEKLKLKVQELKNTTTVNTDEVK